MSSLADRLIECRQELGWKKSELRRRAGLNSPSTLTALEKGATKHSPQLGAIAEALGVEVMWLQYGKGQKHKTRANPATEWSETALNLARLVDALPPELRTKITNYANAIRNMHELEIQCGATNVAPLTHILPPPDKC